MINKLRTPDGANPRQGHCGLVALACVTGMTVDMMTDYFQMATVKRPANWKGSTNDFDRETILKRIGIRFTKLITVDAGLREALTSKFTGEYVKKHYGDPKTWLPPMTLKTFVKRHARPGVKYMVTTGRHVVTVLDGKISDQSGIASADEHRAGRLKVRHALMIGA